MERILLQQLEQCLADNKLMTAIQFGYRKGYTTTDALLYAAETWRNELDGNNKVHVAFLDLSKAFNALNHEILRQKLCEFGLTANAVSIPMNFTSNRFQRVTIDNDVSDWIEVNRGVPQGTVLGPIVYLLYVNNVKNALSNSTKHV